MTTTVEVESEIVPPFSFVAPNGLHALPIAPSPEERAGLSREFVRELYSSGNEAIWEPSAPFYAALAEYMADNGFAYSAMGLFAREEGGVAQCALTVAVAKTDQTDTEIAAQGILAALSGNPYNDARWLDLPCGPAVSCVRVNELTVQPEVTRADGPVELLTGQIQVHVPFSTGPYTVVFTLDTAAMDYWAEFCNMMSAILQTISFESPSEDLSSVSIPA
ncbi:hypothetical protein [Streptomyces roseochromogenus]|uniref:Uncharacterized protein n=1 Tax=Streptomyces roseochromogenus subsp. oscitans DS 12.976 TaxID=1352936 RepID=V6KNJ0_STRRC|nr:hypothetical protein [Streptomyces roseochromogenus]EST30574.1 hypothetical protein M878_17815 [Streptomyces roseochromogenus subsp. oscitans DS 12.976]